MGPQRAREGLAQPRAWSEGDVSAEHSLQCEAGELAGVTRAASQAFQRMHNTMSHMSKTEVPGGIGPGVAK